MSKLRKKIVVPISLHLQDVSPAALCSMTALTKVDANVASKWNI